MKRRPPPSLTVLRNTYFYDPEVGDFIFRFDIGTRGRAGCIAGAKRVDGYIGVALDGKVYLAHQLAWYYHYGEWALRLDHKDHVRSNNRISNLRKATRSQNGVNSFGWKQEIRRYKFPKGVYLDPTKSSKPFAAIRINGRLKMLGFFDTVEEASLKYQEASKIVHGEFSPFHSFEDKDV